MRVGLNTEWIFPNGTYIFRSDGTQINPNEDADGKVLVDILREQRLNRQANADQREKWIKTTFPRDEKKQEEYRKKLSGKPQ